MVIYVASITIYILLINGTFFFFHFKAIFCFSKKCGKYIQHKTHDGHKSIFKDLYATLLHHQTKWTKKKKAPTKRRFKHRYLKSQHKHLLSTHIN